MIFDRLTECTKNHFDCWIKFEELFRSFNNRLWTNDLLIRCRCFICLFVSCALTVIIFQYQLFWLLFDVFLLHNYHLLWLLLLIYTSIVESIKLDRCQIIIIYVIIILMDLLKNIFMCLNHQVMLIRILKFTENAFITLSQFHWDRLILLLFLHLIIIKCAWHFEHITILVILVLVHVLCVLIVNNYSYL